jgi:hypothetical protein
LGSGVPEQPSSDARAPTNNGSAERARTKDDTGCRGGELVDVREGRNDGSRLPDQYGHSRVSNTSPSSTA